MYKNIEKRANEREKMKYCQSMRGGRGEKLEKEKQTEVKMKMTTKEKEHENGNTNETERLYNNFTK